MSVRVGVLGGTAALPWNGEELTVETPWGDVPVGFARRGEVEVLHLARHGPDHDRPAHRVPHRANVWALHRSRVDRVIALHTVGALRPEVPPGTLAVPHDLVDVAGGAPSFHDDAVVHVAMTPPFCPEVRTALLEAAGDEGVGEGVYVQTRGPRLETPAEVRWLARLGDVVGMTAAHEASLAREVGLCYGSLALVTNRAAGLGEAEVTAGRIGEAAREMAGAVGEVVGAALEALPEARACGCVESPRLGEVAGGS